MKRITRDVRLADLQDLLDQPPHAYLAFITDGAVDATPVRFRCIEHRFYAGVTTEIGRRVHAGSPVTLLLDAGWFWYELQAVRIRGTLGAVAMLPGDDTTKLTWFEVVPRRFIAWNYGSLREVDADASE